MTSNHDNVSCDLCRKNNFKGLRYKCLVCYDYDLCSVCYDAGLTSSRHTVDHPMQCIVAKLDFDLFYAGEPASTDHPQSLTCPLCGNLGYTESTLLQHVTNEHANADNEESSDGIVCPICGVETNQLTYDFATHLTMMHRTPRDQMEQVGIRGRGGRCHTRAGGSRCRRSQTHFNPIGAPSGMSPSSTAAARDSTDPLVEILATLSSVRRAGANNGVCSNSNGALGLSSNQSPASQLHQLQMRLQSSPSFSPRAAASIGHPDREVRITRRINAASASALSNSIGSLGGGAYSTGVGLQYGNNQPFMLMDQCSLGRSGIAASGSGNANASGGIAGRHASTTTTGSGLVGGTVGNGDSIGGQGGSANQQASWQIPAMDGSSHPQFPAQYLLSSCMKPNLNELEQQQREVLKADRSLFVQGLLLQVGLLEKK